MTDREREDRETREGKDDAEGNEHPGEPGAASDDAPAGGPGELGQTVKELEAEGEKRPGPGTVSEDED